MENAAVPTDTQLSDRMGPPDSGWVWLVLAAVVPVILLAQRLPLDLWHDEAYTVWSLAAERASVEAETVPQSHWLYALVLWPIVQWTDANAALRLPSLVFSVMTLGVVFRLAERAGGVVAGVAATACLGLNQMFLNYAVQVRGHALSMMLAATAAWLIVTTGTNERQWRWPLAVAVGFALLATSAANLVYFMPLALYAVGSCWWRHRDAPRTLLQAASWVVAGVIGRFLNAERNPVPDTGDNAGVDAFWETIAETVRAFFDPALRDAWWLCAVAAVGALCWSLRRRWREERGGTALAGLAATVIVGGLLICGASGTTARARSFLPWLPLVMAVVGWLLAEALGAAGALIRRRRATWQCLAALALVGGLVGPRLRTYPDRLDGYRDEQIALDGYYDYYAARFEPSSVAAYLAEQVAEDANYVICLDRQGYFTVPHYLTKEGVALVRMDQPGEAEELPLATIYVVVPWVANWNDVSATFGSAKNQVGYLPNLKEFAYFRISRSTMPVPVDPAKIVPPASRGG